MADLHLDFQQPARWERLEQLLTSLNPYRVQGVYILGDLFKYWLGDDYQSPLTQRLQRMLGELGQRLPVYILRGNRDFLLGTGFLPPSVQLRPDGWRIELFGRPTLLFHGDVFCRQDYFYQLFKLLADNWLSRTLFTRLPLAWRERLAELVQTSFTHYRQWRQGQQGQQRYTGSPALSLAPGERELPPAAQFRSYSQPLLDYLWLRHTLQRHGATQVIYGHFHRAQLVEHTDPPRSWREIGLPSWDDGAQWLYYYHDHRVELVC